MFQNNLSTDNLGDFSLSIGQNNQNIDERFSTLWTEVGSEFDMIDESTDYEMLTPSQLQSRCKEAEYRCKYLERKVLDMKDERKPIEECNVVSYDKNRRLKIEIDELKKLNDEITFEKKLLERDIKDMEKEHSTEIENLEETIEDLQKSVKNWQRKYKEKMKELDDSDEKEELEALKKKLKEVNKTVKKKDEETDDLREHIEVLEMKISGLQKDCQKYYSELEKQSQINEKLKNIKQDLQRELAEMEKTIENRINVQSENDLQIMKKDCSLMQNEIERLVEENGKIKKIRSCLEKALSGARNELLVMQEELNKRNTASIKNYPLWWLKHMV